MRSAGGDARRQVGSRRGPSTLVAATPSNHAEADAAGTSSEIEIDATVLICDDEATLRELIRVSLQDGYRFAEASTGKEALDLVTKVAPDVIVLDLMLPGVSGLDILRKLRGDAPTRDVPVVAISAWTHLGPDAIAAGATEFVAKPFDPEALKATVASVLEGA